MTVAVVVREVSFEVTIGTGGLLGLPVLDRPTQCRVQGSLFRAASAQHCDSSVLLLLHGVSQGRYAWDFPIQPDVYSPARMLAAAGYPVVAIDRLGYPPSSQPDGRSLTVEAHADVTAQIVVALKTGRYLDGAGPAFQHVGLMGHSMGSEIAILHAGQRDAAIDLLVVTGWTHSFTPEFLAAVPGEAIGALPSGYYYFLGTPQNRERFFYRSSAERMVIEEDTRRAQLTPSGEVMTTLLGQSTAARSSIDVPVLLVLAEEDRLFPASGGQAELAGYTATSDRTLITVESAGHVLFLHPRPAGPRAVEQIIGWLAQRSDKLPQCL